MIWFMKTISEFMTFDEESINKDEKLISQMCMTS